MQVRVLPRSSRNEVVVSDGGAVRVYVTAAPVGGKANQAVILLLSAALEVAKGSISIAKGGAGRDKLLVIEGLSLSDALDRLSSRR